MYTSTHACMHTYLHVQTCACIHARAYMCACMHACTHACLCACLHACMHACRNRSVCVCMQTCMPWCASYVGVRPCGRSHCNESSFPRRALSYTHVHTYICVTCTYAYIPIPIHIYTYISCLSRAGAKTRLPPLLPNQRLHHWGGREALALARAREAAARARPLVEARPGQPGSAF